MKSKMILLLIVIIAVVSCADRDTEGNILQQKANKTAKIKTDTLQSVNSIINQKTVYGTKAESEAIDPDKYIPIKH